MGGGAALGFAIALLLALVPVTEASAAKPKLGRWEGADSHGHPFSFRVMRAQGSTDRAITYAITGCTEADGRLRPAGTFEWDHGADTPNAVKIGTGGRVAREYRWSEHTYPQGSPFRGRLGKRSGHIRAEFWLCDGHEGHATGGTMRVHHVDEPVGAPVSGDWRALGSVGTDFTFEVFGSGTLGFLGTALSGIGTLNGAPVPCVKGLVAGSEHTWIDPGGSFSWVGAEDYWIRGQFESETSLTGTYFIDSGYGYELLLKCRDFEQPFRAVLEQAGPPPKLWPVECERRCRPARLVDKGGPPPPPPPLPVTLPTPSQPTQYVALGDSYSSGEGVPPFEEGTDEPGNRCHRSTRAYSRLLSPPSYTIQPASLFACSGATTENVGRTDTAVPQPDDGAATVQLDRLTPDGWRPTDLITITIGGNDAGFGDVVTRCVKPGRCDRGEWAKDVERRIVEDVPAWLASTYQAIRDRVPIRPNQPNATVVVLGYPLLFPEHAHKRCPIRRRLFIGRGEQAWLRKLGSLLNGVIRQQASAEGLRFHYVDVTRAFKGHEVCGRERDWLHGVRLPKSYSFHPNRKGQGAYADRLVGYFGCLYREEFGFRPSGVPFNPGNGLVVPPECITGE